MGCCGHGGSDGGCRNEPPGALLPGTGACGISCRACRLHTEGACTTCGAATSAAGRRKLATQRRVLGSPCPLLECAAERGVATCLRDCDDFPCDLFRTGPYPFAEGFLSMQTRRRQMAQKGGGAPWPEGATELWRRLSERDAAEAARAAGASVDEQGRYLVDVLGEPFRVCPETRSVEALGRRTGSEWDRQIPYLTLAYLAFAQADPLSAEMTAPRDLYGGLDAFTGKNAFDTEDLLRLCGRDARGFRRAAAALGGEPVGSPADGAARFVVFPKLPVEILLWEGDEEFPPRVVFLLDRTCDRHFPADGAAAVVNLLLERLTLAASV